VPLDTRGFAALALAALTIVCVLAVVILRTRPRPTRRPAPRPSVLDDYGLLRTVALVENLDAGHSVRALLASGDVRATVATGADGLVRVLVFPDEYDRARQLVSWVL
jgi:hypothetical protein